jgi:hypothetical protein
LLHIIPALSGESRGGLLGGAKFQPMSKYSDEKVFFKGTQRLYDPREYVRKKEVKSESEQRSGKQHLSKHDEEEVFLIRNRDLVGGRGRKIGSGQFYLGMFLN